MARKLLKNKPLIEAIFEIRWALPKREDGAEVDPNYKILIGRLYEKIRNDYPFHEQLPTASLPDEIASYIIQHRFRKGKDEWPLIQIGPGIMTLNDTENYSWEDFVKRTSFLLSTFFELNSQNETKLVIRQLMLRYMDAIEFDYEHDDIGKFLETQMKMNIRIYPKLFENTEVDQRPYGFDVKFVYPSTKPKGAISLRFSKGSKKDGIEGLVWETMVTAKGKDACQNEEDILKWINDAHELTDKWFFMIIEGELLKRFE